MLALWPEWAPTLRALPQLVGVYSEAVSVNPALFCLALFQSRLFYLESREKKKKNNFFFSKTSRLCSHSLRAWLIELQVPLNLQARLGCNLLHEKWTLGIDFFSSSESKRVQVFKHLWNWLTSLQQPIDNKFKLWSEAYKGLIILTIPIVMGS